MDPVTYKVCIIIFLCRMDCQGTPGIQQLVTNLEIYKKGESDLSGGIY